MAIEATTKQKIAAMRAAGWTAEALAVAIKITPEEAETFMLGGYGIDSDAQDRFERWSENRIGVSNNVSGIVFDRPPAHLQMTQIMASPVIVPDHVVAASSVDMRLKDVSNTRAQDKMRREGHPG